jgi:hypothetical protein
MIPAKLRQRVELYAKGKKWYWYVPVWVFGLYVFVNLLGYDPNQPMPLPIAIGQSFDFLLHEMAHILTAFLPAVLTAAAGSLSEMLLGTALIMAAFKTRSYMTSLICCLWFMLACQSAGTYMADARAQKLELVSLGALLSGSDEATHDWHFVFGQLHILNLDTFIGNSVRSIGFVVGLFGLIFTAWVIYLMMQSGDEPEPLTDEESMMVLKAAAGAKKASGQKEPGL